MTTHGTSDMCTHGQRLGSCGVCHDWNRTKPAIGPSSSYAPGVRQWTVKHPNGHIDAENNATSFGPTENRQEALQRLETAESDCLCRDDEDTSYHVLVTRFVPAPTYWEPVDE